MNWTFDILVKSRRIMTDFVDAFSLEDLNKVPENFNNNIIWNIGHLVVTQQLLTYGLSGLPMLINNDIVDKYKKGSKASGDVTQDEVDTIKSLLIPLIEKTHYDYNNGVFKTFKSYTTSTNSTLKTIEEALEFNNFHEGIHLGYILALKKSL
jgi:hypothetical protein